MARIYITYRPGDTSADELDLIISHLYTTFGEDNVTLSEADAEANIFELYKHVQAHDALLILMGQRFMSFADEQGRSLLASAYDYIYTEILAALEKDEMWISTLLVDKTQMPSEDELPKNIQAITRRDIVTLHNMNTIQDKIEQLSKRLGILGEGRESSMVKTVQVPASEIKEKPDNDTIWNIIVLIFVLLSGACALFAQLYETCFRFGLNMMTC